VRTHLLIGVGDLSPTTLAYAVAAVFNAGAERILVLPEDSAKSDMSSEEIIQHAIPICEIVLAPIAPPRPTLDLAQCARAFHDLARPTQYQGHKKLPQDFSLSAANSLKWAIHDKSHKNSPKRAAHKHRMARPRRADR
jgi:hypothetical protein